MARCPAKKLHFPASLAAGRAMRYQKRPSGWGFQEISFQGTDLSGQFVLFLCVLVSLKEGHQIGKKVALRFPKMSWGPRPRDKCWVEGSGKVRRSRLPVSAHGDLENPSS